MLKIATLVAALSLSVSPALAAPEADAARLRADVEKLVSFGTRHTLSSPDHPTRGIGAARRWAATEFAKIGKACGGCITVEQIDRRFTGPRAPNGVNVVNVLGVQAGTGNPDDVIIISAHIDSRVSDVADFTSDAPGANDDGSGVALVLEAARTLSKERFAPTIIYAVLSGEEQGLWGGRLIAETARARGWQVRALLNNDIVGNTEGQDGRRVTDRVRVFSEGIRASESLAEAMARRGSGAEDDGPSRAVMRAAQRVARRAATWDSRCSACVVRTASAAAATICPRSNSAIPRSASPWGSKIMTTSIRTFARKTAASSAIRSTRWISPISPA